MLLNKLRYPGDDNSTFHYVQCHRFGPCLNDYGKRQYFVKTNDRHKETYIFSCSQAWANAMFDSAIDMFQKKRMHAVKLTFEILSQRYDIMPFRTLLLHFRPNQTGQHDLMLFGSMMYYVNITTI